ncbi:MAG: hypothetical protein IKO73_01055 [Bacteroidaceae bacterium]|nr:hypothetical protein [Bacteroidaceae bacterium]
MDYKYIEQLLERYWACETSLQEEQILRTFFQQAEVPAHLMPYRAVFDVQQELAEPTLGEDFDAKMTEQLSEQDEDFPFEGTEKGTVKALPLHGGAVRRYSWRPFYQAAGLVALILTIGMAAQHSFDGVDDSQEAIYTQSDSMENPAQEFTPLPEQQAAELTVEQVDSMSITR